MIYSQRMDAVFISDLHLHPSRTDILTDFEGFLSWVSTRTRALYILGDFFHAWAGDDTMDEWSKMIAARLAELVHFGVRVYFLHGNRDFLLGDDFFKRAQMTLLKEPALVTIGARQVMLVHGDRYCTQDKAHQRFRLLTRNRWFPALFKKIPKELRTRIVTRVRLKSETNTRKVKEMMDVVPGSLIQHLKQQDVRLVIHGHTHQPGLKEYVAEGTLYQQYILSDWDSPPSILCYNSTNGFYFNRYGEENG